MRVEEALQLMEGIESFKEFLNKRPINRSVSPIDACKQYIEELEKINLEHFNKNIKGTNFGRALQKVKHGAGMRLPQWKEGYVVRAIYPDREDGCPYLYMTIDKGRIPYEPNSIELFSDDWENVE